MSNSSVNLPIIAVVMPCYNEAIVVAQTVKAVVDQLKQASLEGLISDNSYVLCCDDGSTDGTWQMIEALHEADPAVQGISLSHNCGHQYALMAALMDVLGKCDAAISIDADLQDDPAAIIPMIRKYLEGHDIVYGVRTARESDTWLKRFTAHAFYRLQRRMGINSVYDHADYRLMSDSALKILSEYQERNLFLRGIVTQIGLKSAIVPYSRHKRAGAKSKYTLAKMASFSADGITSFSVTPIRIILFIGLIFFILALCMTIYSLIAHLKGNTIPGWTSIMISLWFIGSLILIGLGIIGEYIGKIYIEVKARPRYNIHKRT